MATLHYIHDPLCGWCYASQPLLEAVSREFGSRLPIELHAGALFAEPTRLDPARAEHIVEADERIAKLTGQEFGPAYREGLLAEEGTVLYSLPPIVAILAAGQLDPALALPMLTSIQRAHYQRGLRVASEDVLFELGEELGLAHEALLAAFEAQRGDALVSHVEASRRLLAEVGGRGFPTLVLNIDQRQIRIDHQRHYGKPAALVAELQDLIGRLH